MFFRREKTRELTFQQRIENMKGLDFQVSEDGTGKVRVSRDGCVAVVEDVAGNRPRVSKAGLAMGSETGVLVHGGYQMFFITPSKNRAPALAGQLKALHQFEEDLKEALELKSLYNEGLGTTCDLHLYDRVEERDEGVHHPWEVKLNG